MRRLTTRVLVVGGGPVGTALAMDLAWRDIDAAPRQIHRERGADRPAADHQHACSETPHQGQGGQITFTNACCPLFTAAAARRNASGRSVGRSTRSP